MKKILGLTLALLLLVSGMAFAGGAQEGGEAKRRRQLPWSADPCFPKAHVYYRALEKFVELFNEYYDGPVDVKFELHGSGAIGTEKDMLEFMMQGVSVDFGIVSPAWGCNLGQDRAGYRRPPSCSRVSLTGRMPSRQALSIRSGRR